MNKLIIASLASAAPLSLAGCATPNSGPSITEQQVIAMEVAAAPSQDRAEILLGVAIEVGARFHCPVTQLETQVLFSGRLAYDLAVRPRMQAVSNGIVDRLRERTGLACPVEPSPA